MEENDNISWRFHKRDDRKVAASVRSGDIDTITGTGWGLLDKFFCFLYAMDFFNIVDIRSAGYQRIMLPLAVLITTYSVKILLGISSMNKIPALLFREIALLSLKILKDHKIAISMSGKANPYGNAKIESFFRILKVEEVYMFDY